MNHSYAGELERSTGRIGCRYLHSTLSHGAALRRECGQFFAWLAACIGRLLCVVMLGAAPALLNAATPDLKREIVIASGGVTGVYYPVAISICRLFNAKSTDQTIGCRVESTGGSIQNLRKLRIGQINFAIAQSDWQSHAYKGTDVFAQAGPHEQLRSVFALYPEAFTVVARTDAGIVKFEDLLGKRVNIGNPGSGQRATMDLLMRAYKWNRFGFATVREFASRHQAQALCDAEVDAIVFVSGHPSGTIKSATSQCDTRLVEVSGPIIDALVGNNDFYRHATVRAGMYRGQASDIKTFGVGATLVTTADVPDRLVNVLVQTVFTHLKAFKAIHPALSDLKADEMKRDGLAAPLHEAAAAFYNSNQ